MSHRRLAWGTALILMLSAAVTARAYALRDRQARRLPKGR